MTWKQLLGIGTYDDAGAGGSGGGGGNPGGAAGAGDSGDPGAGGPAGGGEGGKPGASGAGSGGDAGAGGGSGEQGAAGAQTNPYQPNDWRHGLYPALSADEKALKVLEKFKDPTAFVKSHAELESFQGQSIRIPGKDAKPEDWTTFYGKLGRPPSPAEYQFERPQLPKDVTMDPGMESWLLNSAFEAGLNNKQVERLFSNAARLTVAEAESTLAERRRAEAELVKEWGMEYEPRLALAKKALETAGPDTAKVLHESGLGNHPAILKAFYALGGMLQESGYVVANVEGITTKEAAAAEVKKLMTDPAYMDSTKPNHKEIVEKVNKLQQLRFPGTPRTE